MTYTAVITGGSKGIGADLAAQLLERDYTVISIARHAPEMKHPNLHSVEADLLDDTAVKAAAAHITATWDVRHGPYLGAGVGSTWNHR